MHDSSYILTGHKTLSECLHPTEVTTNMAIAYSSHGQAAGPSPLGLSTSQSCLVYVTSSDEGFPVLCCTAHPKGKARGRGYV